MKRIAVLLICCFMLTVLNGCELRIPSLTEARDVISAYTYYNKTGELPQNISAVLWNDRQSGGAGILNDHYSEVPQDPPDEILQKALKAYSKSDALKLARHYYETAYPLIESDTKSEYNRLITWKPEFNGKQASRDALDIQKYSSINVALAISCTNAKNFYLAMAASVFALNANSTTAAGNFAAALASYGDDLSLEGAPTSNTRKYYTDAEKIYHFALLLEGKEGNHTNKALPLLVSLGNLYLDSGKTTEAYACFQTALEIDSEYGAAIEGLYNTYMAMKQYQKALDLLMEHSKYPAVLETTAELDEQKPENEAASGSQGTMNSEEAQEASLEKLNTIDAVTTVDFVGNLDDEVSEKINQLLRQVRGKIAYTAPDISMLSQYASLKGISEPMGQVVLQSFGEGIAQLSEDAEKAKEKLNENSPSDETSDEVSEAMGKFNFNTNSDPQARKEIYRTFSKVMPEYSIYTINPYDYANPTDIMVQRYNIEYINLKLSMYNKYMMMVNARVTKNVEEIIDTWRVKEPPLWEQMDDKLATLGSSNDYWEDVLRAHEVHEEYMPIINGIRQVYWNQATSIAVTAYQQKIKKYAEQMYNDCMRHLILISDESIQTALEERLQSILLTNLDFIMTQINNAFSFTMYEEICSCDLEELVAARQARQKKLEQLADEQIKKNIEAKKHFESGILDENSNYYKKIIKPYEVSFSSPFVKGVIGPYKTTMQIKVDLLNGPSLEFGTMENHLRNTTTYNGGIEFGPDVEIAKSEIGVKAYLKLTATQGADGHFAMSDVDVTGGGKLTLKSMFTETEVGMEASAIRGTKSYAGFSLSADELINPELKMAMGYWAPNLKKELWNGEYPIH